MRHVVTKRQTFYALPLYTLTLVFLALLASCAPAFQDGRQAVVLINAPTEHRVFGLAEEFQALLERDPASSLYRFAFPASVRFQETHRDMFGNRALRQAAFIARNLSGRYAVLVGAPRYERKASLILTPLGEQRLVATEVTIAVVIVDPDTAGILFTQEGRAVATRLESARRPLIAKAQDPDLLSLRQRVLRELVLPTSTQLAILLSP